MGRKPYQDWEWFKNELWEIICERFPTDRVFTTVEAANIAYAEGLIKGKGPYAPGYAKVRKALVELEQTTNDLQKVPKGPFISWVLPSVVEGD